MVKFKVKNLTAEQKQTRKRIIEISYKLNLSHLGSCLSSIDLIDAVYKVKEKNEKFVLSNGHAGIALYVILEKNKYIKDPKVIEELHIHPDRNPSIDIYVSTGSLGQGLPIAIGMAIANRKKNVYCMISDGECAEGSIWEALRVASEQRLNNLKIIVNANGWGAYNAISIPSLAKRIKAFGCKIIKVDGHNSKKIIKSLKTKSEGNPVIIFAKTTVEQFSFLAGQHSHYKVMTGADYEQALKELI